MNVSRRQIRLPLAAVLVLAASHGPAAEQFEGIGDPQAGAAPYQLHCASCHGTGAAGDGPAARAFNPPPSDLTQDGLSAEHLFMATREGGMAVGLRATMPSFKRSLSDEAIHDVVAYIQSIDQ